MSNTARSMFLVFGLLLMAVGVVLVVVGAAVRGEVVQGMREEQVTTTLDGKEVPVASARAAMTQYNLIKEHTLGTFGSYASLEQDDPNRAVYALGLTLRNSLIIGRMGLQISFLIMGLGVLFVFAGLPMAVAGATSPD